MGDLNTPAGLMGHSYITGIATRPWTLLCYIPTLRSLQFCTQANSSHFHDQPLAPAVKGKKGMREARATSTLRARAFCPQVFFFFFPKRAYSSRPLKILATPQHLDPSGGRPFYFLKGTLDGGSTLPWQAEQ